MQKEQKLAATFQLYYGTLESTDKLCMRAEESIHY